jgi:nitrite reductase/ring-hydroxylating ferredoxin subunit
MLRQFWVPCLMSSEVAERDGEPVRLTIMGEDLLAFRDSSGQVGLVDAYCAHRGAPLFYGRNEDCGLRCVYHGWKYDVTGRCIDMPNEPATSKFKDHVKLKAYPTQEAGGLVWAYMGTSEDPPELPGLEWLDVPHTHVHLDKYVVDSNFLQALEGDHDSSHASALHSTLDNEINDEWLASNTKFSNVHMLDKAPKLFVMETDYGIVTGSRRNAGSVGYLWRIVPWLKPFYSLIAQEPGHPMTLNVRVPINGEQSWFYRVHYHPTRPLSEAERDAYSGKSALNAETIPGTFRLKENSTNDYLIDRHRQKEQNFTGIHSIPAQDRAVTERMRPMQGRPGTVDRSVERLGTADAAIVQIRKSLLRSIRECETGGVPSEALNPEAYRVRAPAVAMAEPRAFHEAAEDYIRCRTWESQTLEHSEV